VIFKLVVHGVPLILSRDRIEQRCKLHCKYAANFSRARSARLDKLLIELSGPRHHLSLSGCTQTWGQDWLDGEERRACEAALRRPNKPSSFITKTVHQFPVSDIG
jgi:hypothetical protein